MPIEIPKDNWPGTVRIVTIGATAVDGGTRTSAITVGGEKNLPFLHFETKAPNRPAVAIEIKDRRPDDWSQLLLDAWGEDVNDPVMWAKAAEAAGADLIQLSLSLMDENGNPTTPEGAVKTVKAVLAATGLPEELAQHTGMDVDTATQSLQQALKLLGPAVGSLGAAQ